jgi:MFS family permease
VAGPFRALRSRNYRLFFIGQGISLVGSWMTRLATAWLVYRLTDSAFLLGLVSFASQAPSIFLPPLAGVWLDRWDRHKVLIVVQVLAMLQSLALAALTLSDTITIAWIFGLTLFQGLISAVEIPTRQALVVRMIDDRADLGNAIALNSSNFNSARLLGPAIAGAVVSAVGEGYCFLIDGLSYIAVIAGLLSMRLAPETRPAARRDIVGELVEGWQYIARSTPIRSLFVFLGAVGVLSAPYSSLVPLVAGRTLEGGADTLGMLMAASGVGALLCAVRLVLRTSVVGLGRNMTLAVAAFGVSCVLLGISTRLWVSMGLMMVTGFGLMYQVVATNTIVQTIVDDDKRGRVMSYYTIALAGAPPLGALLGGSLASRLGVETTYMLSGSACLAVAIWFWRRLPAIRAAVRPRYIELGIIAEPRVVAAPPD